jgi:outer membrane protein assembly factor BamD (BamD/ComL family)
MHPSPLSQLADKYTKRPLSPTLVVMYAATKVKKQNKEQSALFWFVDKFIRENLNHDNINPWIPCPAVSPCNK